jgi:hypothetical protein
MGQVTPEDRRLFGSEDDLPELFYRDIKEGDVDDDLAPHVWHGILYEDKRNNGLYYLIDLWRLVDEARAQRIENACRQYWSNSRRDENGDTRLTAAEVRELATLFDGLLEALAPVLDENHQVRPEKVDYVRRKNPELAERMSYAVALASGIERFFNNAASLKREMLWW